VRIEPAFIDLLFDFGTVLAVWGLLFYLRSVAKIRGLDGAVLYGMGYSVYTLGSLLATSVGDNVWPFPGMVSPAFHAAYTLIVGFGAMTMLFGLAQLFERPPSGQHWKYGSLLVLSIALICSWFPFGVAFAAEIYHSLLVAILGVAMLLLRAHPYRVPALIVSGAAGCLSVLYFIDTIHEWWSPISWFTTMKAFVDFQSLDIGLWVVISHSVLVLASFRAMRAFVKKSRQDQLTGLLNRAGIDAVWRRWKEDAVQGMPSSHKIAAFALDLDHFKLVNDRFGHAVGDEVLKGLAALLKRLSPEKSILGRVGGEEFIVLLKIDSSMEALRWAEQLRAEVAAMKISSEKGDVNVTTSIGVALGSVHQGWEELVKHSDRALYRAKSEGRNRVCHEHFSDHA
jgi:diguanylate cyclase (GGDEF)-like protein